MGLQNFQIFFDNPAGIYYGGQTVTGRVELYLDSVKKIRGIEICFKGEAHTNWSETESDTTSDGKSVSETVSYDGNENYFTINYYLIGGSNNDGIDLPPGHHVYPFTCALPPTLPSSFEGELGFVRYTVKVTLDRPWKFDQTVKAAFSVVSPLDLNLNPRYREPATVTMEKYFCCCWCKSGPLTGVFKIPCTGFVSGQTIPFTLEVDNASTTPVDGMKISLVKMVTYYSQTPYRISKKKEDTLSQYNVMHTVPGGGSHTFTHFISVLPLPPSNLTNCNIIDIDYEIQIEVMVSGFHSDMHGNIPVVIGTTPLNNMVPIQSTLAGSTVVEMDSGPQQPMVGWVPAGANGPPAGSYTMPPPTYEQSQFGAKTILDKSDSEHTQFNNDKQYFPIYPVYNFNAIPSAPGNDPSIALTKQ